MTTLDLPLLGKWYDMTASGEKKEEYRQIKPYWIRRMFKEKMPFCETFRPITPEMAQFYANYPHILKDKCTLGRLEFKYTHVRIRYGYTKRTELREVESVRIGIGNPEWGAPDNDVIIIKYKEQ